MIKKKCSDCAKKIERKFSYCPYCGASLKQSKEKADFGILGKNDTVEQNLIQQNNPNNPFNNLPFGLDRMMGPLIKQLEKELSNIEKQNEGTPRNIKITFGTPQLLNMQQPQGQKKQELPKIVISDEEAKRRKNLPKKEAESKVKRLSDKIIYEIEAPGIKEKSDIAITRLEEGFEIKAYAKDNCYIKKIPLQIDITDYNVRKDKVIIEMKGE